MNRALAANSFVHDNAGAALVIVPTKRGDGRAHLISQVASRGYSAYFVTACGIYIAGHSCNLRAVGDIVDLSAERPLSVICFKCGSLAGVEHDHMLKRDRPVSQSPVTFHGIPQTWMDHSIDDEVLRLRKALKREAIVGLSHQDRCDQCGIKLQDGRCEICGFYECFDPDKQYAEVGCVINEEACMT